MVSWQFKKQQIVVRSIVESEYRSVANLVAEMTWMHSLLFELHINLLYTSIVWSDKTVAISVSKDPVQHQRTKHIEIDIYFVQEKVLQKCIELRHVLT